MLAKSFRTSTIEKTADVVLEGAVEHSNRRTVYFDE